MLGLRRFFTVLAALTAPLLVALSAAAGPLLASSTVLSLTTAWGATSFYPTPGPTGAIYTDGVASVFAGNGLSGLSTDLPLYTNPAITNLHVSLGSNGRIRIYPGTPVGVTVTAPLAVALDIQNPYGTLLQVPLGVGLGSSKNPLVLTNTAKIPLVGKYLVTVSATGWHAGTVRATGLTASGSPVPDVTLQGSTYLNPQSDIGRVTLVSLARVKTSFVYNNGTVYSFNDTATGISLHLVYNNQIMSIDPLPEAGTGLLLAAAAAGLVARGRRRAGT